MPFGGNTFCALQTMKQWQDATFGCPPVLVAQRSVSCVWTVAKRETSYKGCL